MTTPLTEALGEFEGETRHPRWRYLGGVTWALVLVGGYLRFDRDQGAAGRLLVAIALVVTMVIAVEMLRRFFRRVAPHIQDEGGRKTTDSWDRQRRIATWGRTKAAGPAMYIFRNGIQKARVWTFLGYSVLVMLPGPQTLAIGGSAPLFLRSLVVIGVVAMTIGLAYSAYRWRRVSNAWTRYEATHGMGAV